MDYHVALYIRLSKEDESEGPSESVTNQKSLLNEFVQQHRLSVYDTYIDDGWSGTSFNRPAFQRMIGDIETKKVNMVITKDLSRLGRDTLQVLTAIEKLNKAKVSLYIMNYNIETLTQDGKINPMSQFMITILAEVARMERKTIKERMESGYNNFRANNGKVGRKTGYRKSEEQFLEQYKDVIRLLKKGVSLRDISNATGISVNTVRKCKTFL